MKIILLREGGFDKTCILFNDINKLLTNNIILDKIKSFSKYGYNFMIEESDNLLSLKYNSKDNHTIEFIPLGYVFDKLHRRYKNSKLIELCIGSFNGNNVIVLYDKVDELLTNRYIKQEINSIKKLQYEKIIENKNSVDILLKNNEQKNIRLELGKIKKSDFLSEL